MRQKDGVRGCGRDSSRCCSDAVRIHFGCTRMLASRIRTQISPRQQAVDVCVGGGRRRGGE
eukprot:3938535-Pyramimonas_sp.AAC.1